MQRSRDRGCMRKASPAHTTLSQKSQTVFPLELLAFNSRVFFLCFVFVFENRHRGPRPTIVITSWDRPGRSRTGKLSALRAAPLERKEEFDSTTQTPQTTLAPTVMRLENTPVFEERFPNHVMLSELFIRKLDEQQ